MPNPPNLRLELTWIGKENRPRLEPRILLNKEELSVRRLTQIFSRDLLN